jgi:SPP1 gp7 family putative phage head morphogenesis protein
MPDLTLRPIFPSEAVEAEIRRIIATILSAARSRAEGRVYPAAKIDRDRLWKDIQALKWEGRTVSEMAAMRLELRQLVNRAEPLLSRTFTSESRRHGNKFEESLGSQRAEDFVNRMNREIGVDLTRTVRRPEIRPLIEAATAENVGLIRGLSDATADRLETHLIRKITEGASNKAIGQTIVDDFGFAKARGQLIARDQASKFNSSLNEIRQRQAGVDKYRWSTSKDERVRPSHRAKEGRVFEWDSPPSDTGHPGHDIRCRCTAAAVLEF